MILFKKFLQLLTLTALITGFALSASAQVPGSPQQPDQVDQLAQVLGLNIEQQTEIRAIFDKLTPQIEALQLKARTVNQEIQEQIGPDFDEAEIRKSAAKLGELSGELTALSAILQSEVEKRFTEEQRLRFMNLQGPQQQPVQQSSGNGEMDEHGRSSDDSHYGHGHP